MGVGCIGKVYVLWFIAHIVACRGSELSIGTALGKPLRRNSVSLHVVDDGHEKQVQQETACFQKNERDAKLFQQLYSMVYTCYKEKNKLCSDLLEQLKLVIKENPRVLQSKQPLHYEDGQQDEEIEPLVAFAHIVCGTQHWWSGSSQAASYEHVFWDVVERDENNAHRIKAIRLFIKENKPDFVAKMLKKGTNITLVPDPIVDLISRCHAHRKKESPSVQWLCNFFQYFLQICFGEDPQPYDEDDMHDEMLRGASATHYKQHDYVQLDSLKMARLLVGAQANLSGIHDDSLPAYHVEECASCRFLYNCAQEDRGKKIA